MNNKKNKVIYRIFMLLLVLWLLLSNVLVIHFSDSQSLLEDDFSSYQNYLTTYYGIDNMSYNNFIGEFQITGWAITPTNEPNHDRFIEILLVSADNTYSIKTIPSEKRNDIVSTFNEGASNSNVYGFGQAFLTINMEDGIYDIYFYVQENEEVYGLTKTKYTFEKNGREFSEWTFLSEETRLKEKPSEKEFSRYAVDKIEKNAEAIEISGWTFIEGMNATNQKVTIVLEDEKGNLAEYSTEQIARPDLVTGFDNELYADAGYKANIPVEFVTSGKYTAIIYVQNDDEIRQSEDILIEVTDDTAMIIK